MSATTRPTGARWRSGRARGASGLVLAAICLIASACGQSSATGDSGSGHPHRPPTPRATTTSTTSSPSGAATHPTAPAAATPTTTVPPPTTVPATHPAVAGANGFDGVYEFSGGNSAVDATDPDLAGVDLIYYWSQLEPSPGVFDWAQVDQDMAPWIAAGKKVILRVSPSGAPGWDPPYSASGTPAWVYQQGTAAVHDNGSTLPVEWDPSFLTGYAGFVQAFGAQFNGNPSVAFIEPGIGMGGETLPETNPSDAGVAAWEGAGYTDALWLNTVETIASAYAAAFPGTPVYPMIDRTFFDGNGAELGTLMAWFRARPGWGLQDNGLTATQSLGSEWWGVPLAAEERDVTQSTGECLCADISQAIGQLHARYLLLYRSDIVASANLGYLTPSAVAAAGS